MLTYLSFTRLEISSLPLPDSTDPSGPIEQESAAAFNSEQRIRVDETPLGANADCEEVTTEPFGFSEWNSLAGCEWRVAYRLQRKHP